MQARTTMRASQRTLGFALALFHPLESLGVTTRQVLDVYVVTKGLHRITTGTSLVMKKVKIAHLTHRAVRGLVITTVNGQLCEPASRDALYVGKEVVWNLHKERSDVSVTLTVPQGSQYGMRTPCGSSPIVPDGCAPTGLK